MKSAKRFETTMMLAVGSLLGFGAALGVFQPAQHANAAPQDAKPRAVTTGTSNVGASCCSEGAKMSRLLAMATPVSLKSADAQPPAGEKEEVIFFEVFVPADAVVELEGSRMDGVGELRLYQSPPLLIAGNYTYSIKAT